MELRYYYRILARYRWLILGVTALCLGLMGVVVFVKGPLYESSVIIMEQPVDRGTAQVFGVEARRGQTRERLANLATIAAGREVIRRTRKSTHLSGKEAQWQVVAEPVGWSELLRVSVRSPKGGKLTEVADTLADQISAYWRELNVKELRSRREFVEEGLAQAKRDYQRAQVSLDHFKQQSGLTAVDTETKSELEHLAKLKADLTTSAVDLAQLKARDSAWQSQLSGQLQSRATEESLAADPAVARLRGQLVDDEAQLASLRLKYTDEHVSVKEAARKVEQTRAQLKQQTSAVMGKLSGPLGAVPASMRDTYVNLKSEYAAARARQQALSKVASSAERQFTSLVKRESALASLMLARDSAMNAYSLFQSKLAQMVAQEKEAEGSSPIQVVEAAGKSLSVSRNPQKLGLSVVLGLMLGIGLAVLLHYLDNTIQDLEGARRLELPVQAVIPVSSHPFGALGDGASGYGAIEPYEHLRANLFHGSHSLGGSAMMVTAAAPGAGKSTVAANLAMTLARDGHRVLLVDSDLRRPRQHVNFGVPRRPGLTEVLLGKVALSKAIRPTAIKGLFVVPAGDTPENPAGLLSSEPVRDVVAAMRTEADVVIFDTPPGGAFADAAYLANHVPNVLLVVAPGESQEEIERNFSEQLTSMGAHIAGIVVNKIRPSHLQSYYAYNYYSSRPPARAPESAPATVAASPALPAMLDDDAAPDSAEST